MNQTSQQDDFKESEKNEIVEILERYARYPKLNKWIQLFLDKSNNATFGNATESAMQSYDCKNRLVAGVIGTQNLAKLRGVASMYAEIKGFGLGKMLDIGIAKTLQTENPTWYSMMMDIFGYYNPKAQIIVQNNTQNNIQVSEADAKDFS